MWKRSLFLALLVAPGALGGANLVRNPGFERDADSDGLPDHWAAAGDRRLVAQRLTLDAGRQGGKSARLNCSRFSHENPACHAMVCQMGVPVRRGTAYHVAFWAKAHGIEAQMVSVALSDTRDWSNCGLNASFCPTPRWQRFEFIFIATRTASATTRFQFWFTSTGTLWLDDVVFEEAGADYPRPGHIVPRGGKNLVANASFECGPADWGSASPSHTHWATRMNSLFGSLETEEAHDGSCSWRIELSPETAPVAFFDYFDLVRKPILAPLVATRGYLAVEPGRPHVLSAWLKAASEGTPALLAVREFQGRQFEKKVVVGTRWERFSMPFVPRRRWCFPLVGPDLRERPGASATLWIDAVQLEAGDHPTPFQPRKPLEVGLRTERPGNVFEWGERLVVKIALANRGAEATAPVVSLRLTDFFDQEVWSGGLKTQLPARGRVVQEVEIPAGPKVRGFLRLHATLGTETKTLRLASIPFYKAPDSPFGMNHAYPWPHLLELTRNAGLVWVRDWSLKWKDVEPQKGRFTFEETDRQIDRPLAAGMKVLGLLPFPSAPWSSTAPADLKRRGDYLSRRLVVAHAPRDEAEFENYVARAVAHLRGRVRWFQVFNEPVFTTYALPRQRGYTAADYARWTRVFARAARRANPECKILAGIGYIREGQILRDFALFFANGGLEAVDAVDIHHYPRLRRPEFLEGLLEKLNALMERHGGRKPIWLTEYGYYADDEPWAVPLPSRGFDQPLASERQQAEFAVRWAAIALANGVEKIFYHAGTSPGVNTDSIQCVFYEFGGEPHKVYAAQAVLAWLLGPHARFAGKVDLGNDTRCYAFATPESIVAILWAPETAKAPAVRLAERRLEALDLMGRKLSTRTLTPGPTPVYLVLRPGSLEEFRKTLAPEKTERGR